MITNHCVLCAQCASDMILCVEVSSSVIVCESSHVSRWPERARTRPLCSRHCPAQRTEPPTRHSFIWTGGEEPGADYNLIYWAKLWGSDRGPLALGLPPHTPRFLPTSVFWRSLFIQQKIEAPLPWPPSSASDNVLIRSPATGRVVGGQTWSRPIKVKPGLRLQRKERG